MSDSYCCFVAFVFSACQSICNSIQVFDICCFFLPVSVFVFVVFVFLVQQKQKEGESEPMAFQAIATSFKDGRDTSAVSILSIFMSYPMDSFLWSSLYDFGSLL